nr:PREDICTED: kynurenine formamidase [Bemisia tabaci]
MSSSNGTDDERKSELERLYSPSQWSHRYSAEEVIAKHIQIITQESEKVLKLFPKHELEVSYGQGDRQKCDIFYPTTGLAGASILAFIHGGMWQMMDRTQYRSVAAGFADAGFQVVVAGYDLAPTVTLAQMESQIQQLGSFLLQKAAESGSRGVWVCGHSAGAHLASLLLHYKPVVENLLFQGVILVCGLYNLDPLLDTSYNDALRLDREKAQDISPVSRGFCDKRVKILIITAEFDSPAFKQQSMAYFELMVKKSENITLLEIKNVDHFDIIEQMSNPKFELVSRIIEMVSNKVS